ncbi:hypothetical protein ACV56Z_02590 [Staphylococcus aureus]
MKEIGWSWCQVVVENMPVGVGSYVHYDRKLDGKIAQGVVA